VAIKIEHEHISAKEAVERVERMVALTMLRYDWRRAAAIQNETYVDPCSRVRDRMESTRGPRHQSGAQGSRNLQEEGLQVFRSDAQGNVQIKNTAATRRTPEV
jgi:hypothetical protein